MDVSNKTLAMFLVAAIVVSIAGTIISLNKLGEVSYTGYALTDTGQVNISVGTTLSITTQDDNTIDFGTCTPQGGTDVVISSEVANGDATYGICSGFTPDEILVRNDGNVNANVTINASDWGEAHGGTFLPSSSGNSWIAYKITNASSAGGYNGGCVGNYQSTYTNITNTYNSNMLGCDNLSAHATDNSFEFDVEILVPNDAQSTTSSLTLTFIANNVA